MAVILIKLIAAHLIGDFILQSDRLCSTKYDADWQKRVSALGIHSAVHALLSYIFIADQTNWAIPAIIFASHFIIDFAKVSKGKNNLYALIIDQAIHYSIIFCVWWFLFVKAGAHSNMAQSHFSLSSWLVATSFIAVLSPTSIFIKSFIEFEQWVPDKALSQGLPNAGKWIGYLERILILTFIFTDNVEGIGFLLAAKSVFRFGELNNAKDIKITEYVLLGTFLSFTIAILIGFATLWLTTFDVELLTS
ncbi:DUF3307 domain-containing protein [Prevotella sp. PINT]|uniref:DUF3307 domain-containing protein n=1 Tax=Palleniella intestinalis TaxID=2736291 RepID=UPI001555FC1B|nr:DUF3307 domain-containing protein [Palleniella intestinalis]NPD81334.1 DUF3307 domain-containing protein [Palleniella intestinalis]